MITLPSIISKYEERDIFNGEEFGFFVITLPNKILVVKAETCHSGEHFKECLTVLEGANMNSSEKATSYDADNPSIKMVILYLRSLSSVYFRVNGY
jgi:hypothetical protein